MLRSQLNEKKHSPLLNGVRSWISLLSLGFTLSACGGPERTETPDFVSNCGTWVFGATNAEGYNDVESKILEHFAAWSAPRMCGEMAFWNVHVVPEKAFVDDEGDLIRGESYLGANWIKLATKSSWAAGSLAHEFTHVFEDRFEHRVEFEHQEWVSNGYFAQISATKNAE